MKQEKVYPIPIVYKGGKHNAKKEGFKIPVEREPTLSELELSRKELTTQYEILKVKGFYKEAVEVDFMRREIMQDIKKLRTTFK